MAEHTAIEWANGTFNTHWGCHEVSSGCDNCYAREIARRFGTEWGVDTLRRAFGDKHWEEPLKWNAKAAKAGKRIRVFSNSMSDLFDKNAPEGVRERWFELTKQTPNIDWLMLTKRIGNVAGILPADWGEGYPNVIPGATIVDQKEADRDIQKLLAIPAIKRFLSIEPLLGPVDLTDEFLKAKLGAYPFPKLAAEFRTRLIDMLDWVIVGGESGNKARPMHPAWVRSLRDQCEAANVPFLFKQWGEWLPGADFTAELARTDSDPHQSRYECARWIDNEWQFGRPCSEELHFSEEPMYRVGKKAAGRVLDGVEHNRVPA